MGLRNPIRPNSSSQAGDYSLYTPSRVVPTGLLACCYLTGGNFQVNRNRGCLTYAATCSAVRGGPSYWCGLVSTSGVLVINHICIIETHLGKG